MTKENQSSTVRGHAGRWRVVDIVVAAVVAVASGVIFWAWDFIYAVPTGLFEDLTPGLGAFFGETVAAVVEALLGNPFGVAHALLIGMAQGIGAEIGFAAFRYRRWDVVSTTLAGALTGLCNGGYDWLTKAGWTMTQGAVFTICCVISGAVFGGVLMWFVRKALAGTGVLDRFGSGRNVRTA